jgi:hypothetical protein
VGVPVSSTRASGAELLAPVAAFQLLLATTPATSEAAIGTSVPTKSMLITFVDEPAVVTLRIAVAECVSEPLVPVMLSVELPVVAPVMMLSVEVPEVVMEAGENVGVAPTGKPVADKLTAPVNPLSAATVTV